MRKLIIIAIIVAAALAAGAYAGLFGTSTPASSGGPGAGAFARAPLTVELARVGRGDIAEHVLVVGNLIGAATVDVVPKVNGRLRTVNVRLGDRVSQGQVLAQIEDNEIREQVKQAEASFEVGRASIRERQADLKFAETNLERSRNLYGRQLLPKQTLDDSEARYQSALAQLDLVRAQFAQASARLDELRITRGNTTIVSPVNGFVGRRQLDPGAYASSNSPVVSVVDISFVRLVVNLVEKDLNRVRVGTPAAVEVDALPGETFQGRIARIAPVLDPATRTAELEIEVPNRDFRLKPGMYSRVRLTTSTRPNALVVPRNAVVDIEGTRGVFVPRQPAARPAGSGAPGAGAAGGGQRAPVQQAQFVAVKTGVQDGERVEILDGVNEGDTIVTTGAAALRDGDPIVTAGGR